MIFKTCNVDIALARVAFVVALGGAFAGCSGAAGPDADDRSAPVVRDKPAPGSLTAFRLIRPQRSQADLARAGTALATVLHGKALPVADLRGALASSGGNAKALDVAVGSTGLQLTYRADTDQRLMIDEGVTGNMDRRDIGKDAARTLFSSAFRVAVSSGLVAPTGLNPDGARGSTIVQGEGVAGQPPVEWVSEYIFTVPRLINGIEVHDAGFELSVHRTGQLARVQVFGPTVMSRVDGSGAEVPDADTYSFVASVRQADLDSRVAAEYPDAQIRPVGMRYWLPPGLDDAVIEPAQLYFVAPTTVIDGDAVKARGFYVSYSLKDASREATVWPRVEQHATGDGRK